MGQTACLRSMLLVTAAASLFACHPAGIDDASETDMVVTRQAKDYDYSTNRTYDMPDTIADLCNVDPNKFPIGEAGSSSTEPRPDLDCNTITHAFDSAVLADIKRNIEALGYVRVDINAGEKPDVALLVGALSSNNWVAYTWYPYYPYYGWPPYYGWGIYYPYYPTTSVVNYPTGTLMMDLVSLNGGRADPSGRPSTPSIWSGAITGLLATGDVDTPTRVHSTIDQAFAQSPYLKVGKP